MKTYNSGVTPEPRCYLLLFAWCRWTDAHFCM